MITLHYTVDTVPPSLADWPEQWRKRFDIKTQTGLDGIVTGAKITLSLPVDDSSYAYTALMQHPQLVLTFTLPQYIDFPVGTWAEWQGERYTLRTPHDITKHGTRDIRYQMTLTTSESLMDVWRLRCVLASDDIRDDRLQFSLTATPQGFASLIVRNLTDHDPATDWQVGQCIDAPEKCVSFNHAYIADALRDIVNAFDTEWEITTSEGHKSLHLRKAEHDKDNPLPLSYGRGNGFVPGVGRTTEADGTPVGRMYVQGSDRNINRQQYASPTLLLPRSQSLQLGDNTYQSSADGTYLERSPRPSVAVREDSYDGSDIYPSLLGTVATVTEADHANNFWDFTDDTIPDSLNYADYLIPGGGSMTVLFQDGMLAGKEFDVKYRHTPQGGKQGKRFEIVPQEIDGVVMPSATFCPKAGDHYRVFGIQLPPEWICDNDTQTGASWELFRQAAQALDEASEQRFTFTGQLQGLWAQQRWLNVGPRLRVGGYILFSDTQFAPQGQSIRITGVKTYLNTPYAPTLELSNNVSAASVGSQLRKAVTNETLIDDARREAIQYTRRTYRQAEATAQMLAQAALERFTSGISPVTVATMSVLIGDESMQLRFATRIEADLSGLTFNYTPYASAAVYDSSTGVLRCDMNPMLGGQVYLQHYTLGSTTLTAGRDDNDLPTWPMQSYTSPCLTDEAHASTGYFLYARVNRTDHTEAGTFTLSPTSIGMESEAGYWHLLIGVLTAEAQGSPRAYTNLYGLTEILPGRINTDLIVSTDGRTYFDLSRGEMGGVIKFLSDNGYETLIDGGKIKAHWIDADTLTARRVKVSDTDTGREINILPEQMAVQIRDSQGVETTRLDGETHTVMSEIFGTGSGTFTAISPLPAYTGLRGSAAGATSTEEHRLTSAALHTTSQVMVTAHVNATLTASAPDTNRSALSRFETVPQASITLALYCDTYTDAACTGTPSAHTLVASVTGTGDIVVGGSAQVPSGWHHLTAQVTMWAAGWQSTCDVTLNTLTASYKTGYYRARYFANGLAIGTDLNDCLLAYNGTDNHMRFALNSAGIGLRLDPTGITYRPAPTAAWKSLN